MSNVPEPSPSVKLSIVLVSLGSNKGNSLKRNYVYSSLTDQ